MMLPTLLLIMTASTMVTLVIQRTHFLMSLLALEGMILSLTCLVTISMGSGPQLDLWLFILILTFGACEASLGLALLVTMTRSFGSDLPNILTMTKC